MCLETADRQASLGARLPFSIAASGNGQLDSLAANEMTLRNGRAGTLSNLWNCDDADLESNKNAQHHNTDAVTDVSYEILKYRLVCHQQEFRSACLAEESLQTGEVERLDRGLRTLLDDIRGGLITMTTLR